MRALRPIAFLLVLVAGCRPADPLDWKVYAKTPAYFEAWRDENLRKAPPTVQEEFNHAFSFIASIAPRALAPKDVHATGNVLCEKLHGHTIRWVVLEGYDLERRALQARISTESDNMLRNVKLTEKIDDPANLARFEKVRAAQAEAIERMKARLAIIDQRTKELAR